MRHTRYLCVVALALSGISSRGLAQPSAVSLTGNSFTENFDAGGASMPAGFGRTAQDHTGSAYTGALTSVGATVTTLNGTSGGNSYYFQNTGGDRAFGFLSSGTFTSPRGIVFGFTNNTGVTVADLNVSFDYEKYRSGTRAFDQNFYYSSTGNTGDWTNAATGNQSYAADANNTTVTFNPSTNNSKSVDITGINLANGSSFFLLWTYVGVGGSTNGQALGLDNVTLALTPVPEPATVLAVAAAGLGLARFRRRYA